MQVESIKHVTSLGMSAPIGFQLNPTSWKSPLNSKRAVGRSLDGTGETIPLPSPLPKGIRISSLSPFPSLQHTTL